MTGRRVYLIAPDAFDGDRVTLGGEAAHRVQHVLRLPVGARVCVGDGAGEIADVELETFARGAVTGRVCARRTVAPEPAPHLELIHALPKPALAERLLAPCTALGVRAFHFAHAERTPVKREADAEPRLNRWRRIIRQAAEQCDRAWLPECALYDSLEECLCARTADVRLVGDEAVAGGAGPSVREALHDAARAEVLQWIIGPEGGFSEADRASFAEWGLRPVSLGPHILRLETAAVVALGITQYELGRLG